MPRPGFILTASRGRRGTRGGSPPVDAAARKSQARPGVQTMPTYTLTDASRDLWVDSLVLNAEDRGPNEHPWSVTKRTLHGGRREGVDLIDVDNGVLRFSVVPTR